VTDVPTLERWVVILAGGIGSRFWPASTPHRPKQFLPLASGRPLILDTLDRARALAPASNVLVVAGVHLRDHLEQSLPGLEPGQLLLEPQARGTAPALAWAAHEIITRARDPERAVMVSLHADHVIRPLEGFASCLERAVQGAGRLDRLLTVGVPPSRPETGYGYIEVGDSLAAGVFGVRRFVEKPDRETAEGYLARGGFMWNSGMFVWRPQTLLAELAAHTPEVAGQLQRLKDRDVAGFFAAVPTLTIDHGLMERSGNIAVVEAEFEWDDIGAWAALLRVRDLNGGGNLLVGDARAVDCRNSLVWAEGGPVVAFGLSDLVVVRASGITFVAPLDRTADLKDLLAELPGELREGLG
jgi:mannose-1-phosphate guanylyltransferase